MSPTILVVDDNKEFVALMTSLLENAGYSVVNALKGRLAVDTARQHTPALALIDMLLPDMMGYLVAESIRQHSPQTTFVFMSGVFRGARYRNEVKSRFPDAAYFEKPFDANALLTSLKQLVPPDTSPVQASGPDAATDFEVELDSDVESSGEDESPFELTGLVKISGTGQLTAELRGDRLTQTPLKGPVSGSRPSRVEPRTNTPVSARRGALNDNLPGLFTAFYLANETGELYCQRGKVKKVVYFENGKPTFALSNLSADRFGQFLVRVGKIRPEQLEDVAVVAAQTKRRTGDVLVERGLLKDSERLYFVAQQVKSILYSLFGWEQGQYVMTFRAKARNEHVKLDVFPGNLIVRGVKKLYQPERLNRIVQSEDRLLPSPQPTYQLNEIDLEPWEASLLPQVDGTRTNAELVALAQRPDTQVRAFLAAMVSIDVLTRRDA